LSDGDVIVVRRMPVFNTDAQFPNSLVPQDQASADLLRKIPLGEDVAIKIMRDRSLPQHRLFWSVLRYVAEASEWETAERLLVALKLRLGRYDLMKMPSGKVVPVPDSISFAAMPQDTFQQFMDKSMAIICSEVLPGTDSDRLLRASLESTP
jgi:hypothetical protein